MQYKNLDFLGYPNYRLDNQGNIYRFRFHRLNLKEEDLNNIKALYSLRKFSQQTLAKKFNINQPSICKIVKTLGTNYWILMKPSKNKDGYLVVDLYQNNNHKMYRLNRLICETFHGPCPEGMECRHLDGNKLNNKEDNLCWGTRKENHQDKRKHGTYQQGEKANGVKLKNDDVIMIRYLNKFLTFNYIAKLYKLNKKTISDIIYYRTWKHI